MITETRPAPPRRHRRRALLIYLGVVAAAMVAAMIYTWAVENNQAETEAQRPDRPSPVWVPPQITVPPDGVVIEGQPSGCLGGPDPHTAVLVAQQIASLTDTGAAEFALAVTRWRLTYPHRPDMPEQIALVMADPGPTLDRYEATELELANTGGSWHLTNPEGFTYSVLANDGSTATVVVSVDRQYVPAGDGSLITARLSAEYVLADRGGHWQVHDTRTPVGVGIQSYAGACA